MRQLRASIKFINIISELRERNGTMESTPSAAPGNQDVNLLQTSSFYWCFTGVMIVIMNLTVIALFVRNRKTLTDWLLTNLAIADVCVGISIIPLHGLPLGQLEDYSSDYYLCFILECLANCFMTVASLCLIALSCDRLYYITSPSRYKDTQCKGKIMLVNILYWILSFMVWIVVGVLVTSLSNDIKTTGASCPIESDLSNDILGAKTIAIFWAPFFTVLVLFLLTSLGRSPEPTSSIESNVRPRSYLLREQQHNLAFDGDISCSEGTNLEDGGIWVGKDNQSLNTENYRSNDLQGSGTCTQDLTFAITSGWCDSPEASRMSSHAQNRIKENNRNPGELVNGRQASWNRKDGSPRLIYFLFVIFVITRMPLATFQVYLFISDITIRNTSIVYRMELALLFLFCSNSFFTPIVLIAFRRKFRLQ